MLLERKSLNCTFSYSEYCPRKIFLLLCYIMNAQELIKQFGYADSSTFLCGTNLNKAVDYAHVFRKAKESCGLKGVYTLKNDNQNNIPLVYVCEISDEKEADIIHRRVWNQDIVPFLLLVSPNHVRLYSGFEYTEGKEDRALQIVSTINQALAELGAFKAESIDNGSVWKSQWGHQVRPENRVDWKLLAELEKLGKWLIKHGLDHRTANALVGKYVYLRYLKDRKILSPRRLAEWQIPEQEIFGRDANVDGFRAVDEQLKQWLNGDIFSSVSCDNITDVHINKVASVFYGDEVSGQMTLFAAYDFSYIPLETLSVVYEQFLHAENRASEKSAYYTPVHLVNFILNEVESRNTLRDKTKVLDPACGSGAFLVQAYRRIIEQELFKRSSLRPVELRNLLTKCIFGIDQDEDACQVAGLSLSMTLLDYIDPPDLWGRYKGFKLPELQGRNIIQGDFFSLDILSRHKFDWIVSNPPWKQTTQKDALAWMQKNKKSCPTGSKQIAEAFAWKVLEHVQENGAIGILMPAMSLFKSTSTAFRQEFFQQTNTWAVVNFANLAPVLFAGRAGAPAAAVFYAPAGEEDTDEMITVFSPFRITQPTTRSKRNTETWSVTVNSTELRQVRKPEAVEGKAVTWKLALWGSHRDARLLESVTARFPHLSQFAQLHNLAIHQGLEIRSRTDKDIVAVSELVGKSQLLMKKIPKETRYYSFPSTVLDTIPKEEGYVRKGRDKLPLHISRPPHIIVDVARRFAIYSDKFIAVPARQIGVAGTNKQSNLLKALALYMSSDFAHYYDFFHAEQTGVQRSISNLSTLKALPIPSLLDDTLKKLARLHDKLVATEHFSDNLFESENSADAERNFLEQEVNKIVNQLLGLSKEECLLVHDLVHERRKLLRGKISTDLMQPPSEKEMHAYIEVLQEQLNSFLDDEDNEQHIINVLYHDTAGMLEITIDEGNIADALQIRQADKALAQEFTKLRSRLLKQHSQWLYFERNLTVFDNERTYLFKPMERLHWLPSQALTDASDLIAKTMCAEVN
ncbi:MAG: SAM-dependent methyltransferase [Candidatus Electrothrix sp. AR3]|nr:SAM-dependent methyltransferase [Candidatus Electrothrix sp. AR3]